MLGHKLVQCLGERFCVYTTLRSKISKYELLNIFNKNRTFEDVAIEDFGKFEEIINKIKPEVVINAAGIIKQLPVSKDIIQTLSVNSIFPHKLAELAAKHNFRLILISTDCVFSGDKGNYIEEDIPDAFDLYGKSKNLGEVLQENCLTIRTSIIGREIGTGHSLVEWFFKRRGQTVKGYTNAVFSGFPTNVFADIISNLIVEHPKLEGLYHISSEPINKFDLLTLIKKAFELEIEIEPFADFRIDRSLDSTKFRQATGFVPPGWEQMIKKMSEDKTLYNEWKNQDI